MKNSLLIVIALASIVVGALGLKFVVERDFASAFSCWTIATLMVGVVVLKDGQAVAR